MLVDMSKPKSRPPARACHKPDEPLGRAPSIRDGRYGQRATQNSAR
jgi:hypothetical protein